MENRVLTATHDELSKRDLDVLTSLLDARGPVTSKHIAEKTGMSAGNVSTYKRRFLEQGVVEDAGRGSIRFALPMLREFLPEYLEHAGL